VSAAPSNGAVITLKTGTGGVSYQQSLLLHPNCLMLATRPLKVDDGAGIKTSVKTGNRVSIRATEYTNGDTLKHTMRFDMLWGIACDPRLGLRLTN
jgi:P22 coat protein - gene protein 5